MEKFLNCYIDNKDNISDEIDNKFSFFILQKILYSEISKSIINICYKICNNFYAYLENYIDLNIALENNWSFVVLQQCRYHSDILWQPVSVNLHILNEISEYMTIRELLSFMQVYNFWIDEIISHLSIKKIFSILEISYSNFLPFFDTHLFIILEKIYFYHRSEDLIIKMIGCRTGHNFIRRFIEDDNYHILPLIKDIEEYKIIYSHFYPKFKNIKCPVCRKINTINFDFPLMKGIEGTCCICMTNSPQIIFPQCCHINTCSVCINNI
jgi:hypothetical protein